MMCKIHPLIISCSLLLVAPLGFARHRHDGRPEVPVSEKEYSSHSEEAYVPKSCTSEAEVCDKDTRHLEVILKFAQKFENETGKFVSFKMSELEELLDILREADIGEEAWAAIQESPEACAKYFLPVVKMVAEKSGIDDPVKFTSEFCKEAKATGSLVRSLTTFLGGVKTPSIKSVVAGVGAATLIVIAIRWFRP